MLITDFLYLAVTKLEMSRTPELPIYLYTHIPTPNSAEDASVDI